jgi:hypothetical protein
MTMPDPSQMRFLDVNNPLCAGGPARIDSGIIGTEQGQMGVLTVRTASTTLTVVMSANDLRSWADHINGLADHMDGSGTKLVSATMGDVVALDTTMRKPG